MEIETVRAFFMWCTIVNVAVMIFTFLICVFAGDLIYRKHSKWFPMPRETFNVVLYSYLGVYKIGVLIFNLVPYVALLIMG